MSNGRTPHGHDGVNPEPMSPDDRHTVTDALVQEMAELFHGYVGGTVPFEELTFEMYETLQTLFAITRGDVSIEYYDDDGLLEDLLDRGDEPGGSPRGGSGQHGHPN